VGKFTFRADFDSANLHYCRHGSSPYVSTMYLVHALPLNFQVTENWQALSLDAWGWKLSYDNACSDIGTMPGMVRLLEQEVQLWTRKDCQGTSNERGTRSWFHFGISGHNTVGRIASVLVSCLSPPDKQCLTLVLHANTARFCKSKV